MAKTCLKKHSPLSRRWGGGGGRGGEVLFHQLEQKHKMLISNPSKNEGKGGTSHRSILTM